MSMQFGPVDRLKMPTYPEQEWKESLKGLQPRKAGEEYEEIQRVQGGFEALLGDWEWRERTGAVGGVEENFLRTRERGETS